MKKIYYTLILSVFLLFGLIQNVNANTDETNAFNFKYDCINGQGILKTDFSLGGHHHYYRQYHINKPGIIEIADSNHTTVAKTTNISIDGCNYIPSSCNITSEGNWEYLQGEDTNKVVLNISTNLNIDKSGNNLLINGSGTTENIIINFENNYISNGKDIKLQLLDNKIQLLEYGYDDNGNLVSQVVRKVEFNNRTIAGKKEFYYEIDNNNKKVILKQRRFKKVSTGVIKSSNHEYDIFSAYDGSNSGGDSCSNPSGKSNNGYCTGLNYWDYTQHHYTTTKVKLHRVDINCSKIEYSDNSTPEFTSESYDGTLGGIITPIFSGPVIINGVNEGNWGATIYSSDKINISGLKYEVVGKIGGQKMGVKKIMFTLKSNDITLGKSNIELDSIKNTTGNFPYLKDIAIKDNSGNIITKKAGNYQIVFTFFDKNGQQLGTYETPLTIIPNNDLKVDYHVENPKIVYATTNNNDKVKTCIYITDKFGNKINKNYNISKSNISILNGVINNGYEVLKLSNLSFKNSNFCFDIVSLAPAKKVLKFKIKVPLHKQNINLSYNSDNKYFNITTQKIEFKKPLKISELKIVSGGEYPEIGKEQKYELRLENIGNAVFNGNIDINKNYIKPILSGHKWLGNLKNIKNNISNTDLKSNFVGQIDAEDNILKAPGIDINNLPISYTIGGKQVKYNLDNYSLAGNSDCNKETLGVKLYGSLQGDGKGEITGQSFNVSDLSKGSLRAEIRKNAYQAIVNLPKNKLINQIYYFEGQSSNKNLKYSKIKNILNDNDTVVVKDGNFVIDENINKNIGIIVLKNNYDVVNDYDKKGNIYLDKQVREINAIIYADGALRSADANGTKYSDSELSKSVTLNGTLFTRNTIGGAVKGSTTYTLPGGKSTTFEKAEIYDLNYLRKVAKTCDGDDSNDYSFIIRYDPRIQTNPPKLFGK